VRKVVRDDSGYFYLLGTSAIQKWDGKDFQYINHSVLSNAGLSLDDVDEIRALNEGLILFVCNGAGHHYVLQAGSLTLEPIDLRGHLNVTQRTIYATIASDSRFSTRACTISSGLQVSKGPETYKTDYIPIQVLPRKSDVLLVSPDSTITRYADSQYIELGISGSVINSGKSTYIWTDKAVYSLDYTSIDKIVDLPSAEPHKLSLLKSDRAGNIIAAYSARPRFNEHLYVLNDKQQLRSLPQIIGRNRGLFRDLHTDDAAYQWMFVGYNAVSVINLLRDGSEFVFRIEGVKKNRFSNVISGLASDGNSTYFLKESRGIYKVNPSHPKGYELQFPGTDFTRHFTNNGKLVYSEDDHVFYSYRYQYDGTSKVVEINTQANAWREKSVPFKLSDILARGNGSMLIAGWKKDTDIGRLAIYNFDNGKLEYPLTSPIKKIRSIYWHETTQTYWVGTVRGLHVLDATFKEVAVFNSTNEKASGRYLAHPDVIMVNTYRDMLVAGSLGGAYVIDPAKLSVVKSLNNTEELSNGQVIGIMPDNNGYCWLTTFNGVNVMDKHFNIVQQIYDHQGLSHREFNSKSICKDGAGNIYGGTLNGVTKLTPRLIKKWKETGGFHIRQVVRHKGKISQIQEINDMKLSAYSSSDSIEILYERPTYYRFPFLRDNTAFSSMDSSVVSIGYRNNAAVIKDLSPGTFNLKIEDPDSNLSQTIEGDIRYDVTQLLLVLGSLLLIGLLVLFTYRYNRRKIIEESLLDQRISELRLTALQSQMNPHFIFNALGAIQYFIQTHDVDKADEYLSNFAMLMRRILDSSKTKYVPLYQEIETLKLYVGLEAVRFEGLFQFEFVVDEHVDSDLNVPPMVLQPYVENAINHGLYNLKERQGHLRLSFSPLENDGIKITIEDNGVGRKKAEELRTKRHKSRGMKIIKDRINTLNSLADIHVEVVIEDLYADDRAAGTKVEVTMIELSE
jgi:hypothetical protein